MSCRLPSLLTASFLVLALAPSWAFAQTDTRGGETLLQYVQKAAKSGQKRSQAQQKAIKAGWPPAAVRDAVAHVYGISERTPAASAGDRTSNAAASLAENSATHPDATPDASVTGQGTTNPPGELSIQQPAIQQPAAPAKANPAKTPYEYHIGDGDVLQISVWKEPEASANVVVRPDGMISTPLTKEIQVAGLTPSEAGKLITEKLVKVIQEPDVTVVVTGINSKKIYAIGAVKREGPIAYTYSMTIMQAIAEAGGLTDYAKRKSIYVLRHENSKDVKFPFNYDDVLRGNHIDSNITMLPGDTLVVPH